MARARNIKPGFFKNENLVDLPYETRLLFIGLWTLADREGRLEDRPKRIKMEIFPADDVNVDACLDQLQASGFILRYTVGDARYIQVLAFTKHQHPHVKEGASTIPAPGFVPTEEPEAPDEHHASPVQAPDEHHASPSESPLPITENPLPTHTDADAPDAGTGLDYSPDFLAFYTAYPKRVGKGAAWRAWKRIKPTKALQGKMIEAVQAQRNWPQWQRENGKYIPNPATWLNEGRWDDEPPQAASNVRRFVV